MVTADGILKKQDNEGTISGSASNGVDFDVVCNFKNVSFTCVCSRLFIRNRIPRAIVKGAYSGSAVFFSVWL